MRLLVDDEMWVVGKNDTRELLRDFMKRRREEQGITISGLENMAGVSHPSYRSFELGEIKISFIPLICLPCLDAEIYIMPALDESEPVSDAA